MLLVDSLASGVIGFQCIDASVTDAAKRTSAALSFLASHIGAACVRKEFDHDTPNFEVRTIKFAMNALSHSSMISVYGCNS